MSTVAFTVYGHPEPAGSKRAFKHPHTGAIVITDANKRARPWKQEVAKAALAVTDGVLFAGPCWLDVTFYLTRPKGHYGTGANAGTVKTSSPAFPTVKPDTTKLLRGLEDALTGVVWRDDSQVVDQYARKRYGTPERCEVTVRALSTTFGLTQANRQVEGEERAA